MCVGIPIGMNCFQYGLELLVTLRAKLSGAAYCNRSCLFVFVGLFVGLLPRWLEIAFIDLHHSGFVGEGSDRLQLIKFWPSCAPGKGSAAGQKCLAPPYYSQRAVFASLRALLSYLDVFLKFIWLCHLTSKLDLWYVQCISNSLDVDHRFYFVNNYEKNNRF